MQVLQSNVWAYSLSVWTSVQTALTALPLCLFPLNSVCPFSTLSKLLQTQTIPRKLLRLCVSLSFSAYWQMADCITVHEVSCSFSHLLRFSDPFSDLALLCSLQQRMAFSRRWQPASEQVWPKESVTEAQGEGAGRIGQAAVLSLYLQHKPCSLCGSRSPCPSTGPLPRWFQSGHCFEPRWWLWWNHLLALSLQPPG